MVPDLGLEAGNETRMPKGRKLCLCQRTTSISCSCQCHSCPVRTSLGLNRPPRWQIHHPPNSVLKLAEFPAVLCNPSQNAGSVRECPSRYPPLRERYPLVCLHKYLASPQLNVPVTVSSHLLDSKALSCPRHLITNVGEA